MTKMVDNIIRRWNQGGNPIDPNDKLTTALKAYIAIGAMAAVAVIGVTESDKQTDNVRCDTVTVDQGDTLRGIATEFTDTNQARTELTAELIKQNDGTSDIFEGDTFKIC